MNKRYIRIATYDIDQVLPFVFNKEKRFALKQAGVDYTDFAWRNASTRRYFYFQNEQLRSTNVAMGSHRYQLFLEKGIECIECGLKGKYFALERGFGDNPNRFHFNLYGVNDAGDEILMTKDHILPRSAGGRNVISNYQTMCCICNQNKSDRIPLC